MLSPYQQILKKQQTDAERDAFLLKKTLELISIHKDMIKRMGEIEKIKASPSKTPGPKGPKGDPGSYTPQEVVKMIMPYIPRPTHGKTPSKEELVSLITPLIPKVDVEHVAKIAAMIVKSGIPTPKFDPKYDFEQLLKGKRFQISDIEGLEETLKQVKRYSHPYLHGGGVPSLSAGTGITLTPKSDGGFTISTNGFQVPLSGVIDGVNKTFVWTTAPRVIFVDQGRPMQATNSAPDSTVNWTGTTTTVFTIAPTFDLFAIA